MRSVRSPTSDAAVAAMSSRADARTGWRRAPWRDS
jgi:hypothetical protein